jgi:hypothetical protein
MESEAGREVGVDLCLVLAGDLFLADADQAANEFLASHRRS